MRTCSTALNRRSNVSNLPYPLGFALYHPGILFRPAWEYLMAC